MQPPQSELPQPEGRQLAVEDPLGLCPGLGCAGLVGVELPGERNVACLVPPGTETGDFKDGVVGAGEGSPAGDFSLGSRALGGSGGPLGNLVGERMLSLAKSGLVGCLSKPGCVGGTEPDS